MATIAPPFTEFNESKKDQNWFFRLLNEIRNKKQFLISKNQYDLNQSYFEATYDTSRTRKMYDSFNVPIDDLGILFEPLDLLGSRVNSIVSIIEKMNFQVKANCLDPTAKSKKDEDIDLLKAEAALAPIRKQFANALGLQKPLPVSKPEDFSSDISPIAKNNLDITNPIDEGIFKDYLQRQIWEVAIEIGAQHYLNISEYNEKLKQILRDLINDNCSSAQVVTNSYSGEPELLYVAPYNAYTVLARQPDGKDALGKGWEQPMEVRKIIGVMGKDITMDDLIELLSLAAPMGSNTNYEGIWMYGSHADPTSGFGYPYGTPQDKCCDWQKFLNMQVTLGYLEVKSQNSDVYVHSIDNGNLDTVKENYDFTLPKGYNTVAKVSDLSTDKDRFLEYKFYDVTYKGYYIPQGNFVFGFGKLPLAVRYGTTNELTDFSLVTYKLKGKSMNEKCQPFIKHIFDLWCRMQFFINRSRPSGEMWNIETVRQMAKDIIGVDGNQGKTIDTLKVLESMLSGIYVPQTVNGEQTGGDAMPVHWQTRGLDPTTIDIYNFIQRDKNSIVEITGVSDTLLATSQPNDKTGLGVSQIALQQSLNTIYYLQSALEKIFSDIAFNLNQKVQLIANGNVSEEAYISLSKAIGDKNVEAIKLLGNDPPTSFSISIEFGMNELERQEIKEQVNIMLQGKLITAGQAVFINELKNYKLAALMLGLYEAKNMQMQQAAQQQSLAAPLQLEQVKHQNEMELTALKNKGLADVATITGTFAVKVEDIKAGVKVDTTHIKEISKHISNDTSHQQDLQKTVLDNQLESQNNAADQSHERAMQNAELMNQQKLAAQQPQTAE
jgi:hypothetical protein